MNANMNLLEVGRAVYKFAQGKFCIKGEKGRSALGMLQCNGFLFVWANNVV